MAGAGNNEALNTDGHSLNVTTDLSVGALAEAVCTPLELLLVVSGHHIKGFDQLTLLVTNGEGIVSIIPLIHHRRGVQGSTGRPMGRKGQDPC